MTKGFLDPLVQHYVTRVNQLRESPSLRAIRELTAPHPMAMMQIPVEQGRLLALLALLVNARKTLEVGVFTGYSTLAVAEQLPAGGRVIACDTSEEWTALGRPHWAAAGVTDRIDLRLGPAEDSLRRLIAAGDAGSFDLAFIDADKEPYERYYELCLTLLRPGGVVAVDNIFMNGRALEPGDDDLGASAIHRLTQHALVDERVDPVLVPIADGMLIARKR